MASDGALNYRNILGFPDSRHATGIFGAYKYEVLGDPERDHLYAAVAYTARSTQRAMADVTRRHRLRFSDVPEQGDADVTENQNADDEGGPHDLQAEEEEEEEEPELEYQQKGVDSANFVSKLFWW